MLADVKRECGSHVKPINMISMLNLRDINRFSLALWALAMSSKYNQPQRALCKAVDFESRHLIPTLAAVSHVPDQRYLLGFELSVHK